MRSRVKNSVVMGVLVPSRSRHIEKWTLFFELNSPGTVTDLPHLTFKSFTRLSAESQIARAI
jgi:hypothetical protein